MEKDNVVRGGGALKSSSELFSGFFDESLAKGRENARVENTRAGLPISFA